MEERDREREMNERGMYRHTKKKRSQREKEWVNVNRRPEIDEKKHRWDGRCQEKENEEKKNMRKERKERAKKKKRI